MSGGQKEPSTTMPLVWFAAKGIVLLRTGRGREARERSRGCREELGKSNQRIGGQY